MIKAVFRKQQSSHSVNWLKFSCTLNQLTVLVDSGQESMNLLKRKLRSWKCGEAASDVVSAANAGQLI